MLFLMPVSVTAQNKNLDRLRTQRAKPFNQLELSRSNAIFSSVLDNVSTLYVDTFDTKKIVTRGINAMLSGLDPYTIYMEESETESFRFMTTGEYGGIGAFIQEKDSAVYVANPMPGTPAVKVGLKIGDKFVKIDGQSVVPGTASKVSSLLKGPIGTNVKVAIQRLGEKDLREITIQREKVVVDQVVHRGLYGDGVGFVRLSSFTDKSAQDVLNAYNQLKETGKMKSFILDLRSNGGGVLDGAIDILSMFIPGKELVLYTEGRQPGTSQKYYSSGNVVDPDIPIVVLINNGSASASEIVAGTLQDLDRAVLVGSKSFGKGLVQTTRPLPYKGVLKVTVSRYHIPSGRCIQQLDYSHRNPDGSVAAVPDSLTNTFYTKNGRVVKDGGGIRPDIEVEDEVLPGIMFYMIRDGWLFEYANRLYLEKPEAKRYEDVVITDQDLDNLVAFLEERDFKYGDQSLKAMKALQELAKFEGYEETSKEHFESLKEALTPNLKRDIEPHREAIRSYLRGLLANHYFGMEAQYAINLKEDPTFLKAIEILSHPEQYNNLLKPQKEESDEQ